MAKEITINTWKIKKNISNVINFFSQKKVANILLIILFIFLLIGSSAIRLQNLPLLKDTTTGEYIPLALDPFYFLRVSETLIQNNGVLPEYDEMRKPFKIEFTNEILPQAIVLIYKVGKILDPNITLQFIDVISPVIFFLLGLIIFLLLIYSLTDSKSIAIFSSIFLAFIPSYLYRTLAGFSDHESIGMFAFFLALLFYSISLKYLDNLKDGKEKNYKPILFGILVGFFSAFTIASWPGIAKFIFMIFPFSFIIFWILKTKKLDSSRNNHLFNFVSFYVLWILSTILFGLFYGFSISYLISSIFLSSSSILTGLGLLLLISDFLIIKFIHHITFFKKEILDNYRIFFSLILSLFFGIIFLSFLGGDFFSWVSNLMGKLLHPFGEGRVGLTIAENKQPFLNDWINQTGRIFFWLFYLGLIFVGVEISKRIKKNKKIIIFFFWILMISGILFSRISSSSLLNGTNFLSKLIYIFGILLFFGYSLKLYLQNGLKLNSQLILIFSWLFFTLIAGRGAVRLLFAITPFTCFMGGYAVIKTFEYFKKAKTDLSKLFSGIILIILLFGVFFSINSFVVTTSQQAKYTGPSANIQWQNAMEWVRENTLEDGIFLHWWDYGYWVQYLGKRSTLSDGGHFEGIFRDHMVGRYVLTTPYPETAISFMKTNNASYLLIDPTDIGKYPAYSKIGSDASGKDRYGGIQTLSLNSQQTKETSNSIIYFYNGGFATNEDILDSSSGEEIFLPASKTVLIGITIEKITTDNKIAFAQPKGIFFYNQKQISIPLRYLSFKGELIDFETGLNSSVKIIEQVSLTSSGVVEINDFGAIFYLSPKISNSLFAQLYLLNDPLNKYPQLNLIYSEQDPLINNLKIQGANIGEFIMYQGVLGPIKIWALNFTEEIPVHDEFLRREGEYAELDYLFL